MGLTASKVLYGPFDLDCLVAGTPDVSQYARTGLKEDSVAFNGETFEGEERLGDGSKVYWEEGRELVIEITLSELDPTATTGDLKKIEDADKITLAFTKSSKTITITDLDNIIASIDGLKTKIIAKKSKPLADEWSSIFSIA